MLKFLCLVYLLFSFKPIFAQETEQSGVDKSLIGSAEFAFTVTEVKETQTQTFTFPLRAHQGCQLIENHFLECAYSIGDVDFDKNQVRMMVVWEKEKYGKGGSTPVLDVLILENIILVYFSVDPVNKEIEESVSEAIETRVLKINENLSLSNHQVKLIYEGEDFDSSSMSLPFIRRSGAADPDLR